jgi:inosine-uridine nucleoside N-ribohydrolase
LTLTLVCALIQAAPLPDPAPGVDDILALLLALAAKPEELEILLISVTYGNVEVQRYFSL